MDNIEPVLSVRHARDAVVATLMKKRIVDEADVQRLEESLLAVVEQAGRVSLVIEFCNVKFLSSSVLGVLIRISKRVYEQDGRLALCSISEKIYEVFKITRLNKIFDIYPDASKALDSFSNGA